LEPGSLEVFPLYDKGQLYGAIQHGIHNFFIREQGKEDRWTGIAKFTHTWLFEDQKWKLAEVLSYDHREPSPEDIRTRDFNRLLKENKVPALGLAIIKNGKLHSTEIYGSLDGDRVAPQNSIFKVASLTKPVVAMTALKLIEQGLLEMDEPLYIYWVDPDLKGDKRYKKLTPKLVLTHQTGFPNWRYLQENNKLGFQFDPGTQYQYSGEGFEYLRKAIEKKLGKPIEELAEEMIFRHAGMTDTRFWWDKTMDESRYARNFDSEGNQIPIHKYYEAKAAANLLTTITDYGRFLEYVISGAELSEGLFREMTRQQVKVRDENFFGLGWEILTGFSEEEYALLHTGKDPGVSTLAIIFPKSGNGFLIFLNGDNAMPLYETLLTEYLYKGEELWAKR
ncbi:MAG: beta-lactamase family protein, partial [Flavobacteriaceae bacterium]|nr:beta-lactamase family protein [Flavobacteriaceae bacterium]